jgi:hypothetical protein
MSIVSTRRPILRELMEFLAGWEFRHQPSNLLVGDFLPAFKAIVTIDLKYLCNS